MLRVLQNLSVTGRGPGVRGTRRPRCAYAVAIVVLAALAACQPGAEHTLLIEDVVVIDPATRSVRSNQCVMISGELIAAVADCDGTEHAVEVIDGRGKYLIPGLWDMHVHALWDESLYRPFFADFVRFGVVGIRDMASRPEVLAAAREFAARPGMLAPEFLASGPVVDGPQPLMPGHAIPVGDAAEARAAVAELAALGADFVKPYTLLPREAALALLDESASRGLRVAGHLPASLDASDAIQGGMDSIEHLAVGTGGLCDLAIEARCRDTFRQLRDAGVYLTPTLLIRSNRARLDEIDESAGRLADMPELIANDWQSRRAARLARLTAEDWQAEREQYAAEQRYTEIAIEEGALLLAGTDAGDLYVPPGSSLHDELKLLVDAGMSPMDALRSATSVPAGFLDLPAYGRVSRGAVASLLLLDGNPLDDIRATRNIVTVILRGREKRFDNGMAVKAGATLE